jgi:hypothetical protein
MFGCENVTSEVIYLLNSSWKFSNIFSFEKELIAHFSAFLANCLGDGQNLQAQKGKY